MPIQVLMPALSPTMTEGKLSTWLKNEGDTIASGDVIAEIETDKATMEVEAVEEGTLAKIVVAAGTEGVAVNSVIAVILEEGEDASALEGFDLSHHAAAPAAVGEVHKTAAAAPAAPVAAPVASGSRVFASPLARRMAAQEGLDIALLSGTGPRGRIVKHDIETALVTGAGKAAPAGAVAGLPSGPPSGPVGGYTEVPHSGMRKIIASRLQESKQTVPHFYLTADCEIDALLDVRKRLNAMSPEGEGAYKLSVNDFIIKAVAKAMREVPEANASWTETAIQLFNDVDISVAVATPGGLITPIVRSADLKGIQAVSGEVKELAGRAKEGKLMPEEYTGGGFTISNMGMYGIKDFAAIINPPQSCILAVGAGEPRPVVKNGELAIATVMSCTLSVDHRSVDGAVGATFMAAFKRIIEEPVSLML